MVTAEWVASWFSAGIAVSAFLAVLRTILNP